jgi:hypothetical protein
MKQLFFVEVDLVSPADGPLVERLLLHAAARQFGELAVAHSVAVAREPVMAARALPPLEFRDTQRMRIGGAS